MISADSRYSQSALVTFTVNGADRQVIVAGQQAPFTVTYSYHQVTGGETIDQIAYASYGDATRWWVIADANPEVMNWSTLASGSLIRVPNG